MPRFIVFSFAVLINSHPVTNLQREKEQYRLGAWESDVNGEISARPPHLLYGFVQQ